METPAMVKVGMMELAPVLELVPVLQPAPMMVLAMVSAMLSVMLAKICGATKGLWLLLSGPIVYQVHISGSWSVVSRGPPDRGRQRSLAVQSGKKYEHASVLTCRSAA